MIASPITLAVIALIWVGATFSLWRSKRWLAFYITGAFGFVLLALSIVRSTGFDVVVETWQAQQVVTLARLVGLRIGTLGGSGLAIPSRTGWAVFDIGIECSALLETFVFAALCGFYPAFDAVRKTWTIVVGAVATYVINLLRIVLIMAVISWMGTGWVYPAHAVFGRVFFFAATIAVYWYLVTRPTISVVSRDLSKAAADG
jgi:exosortase family protein XrtG